MSELTDDQLDGLFRKSAEEFDPPFDPAAWRDMKTRLDASDRTVGVPFWKKMLRWGLPIGLLLLLSGGGWYAYRRTNPGTVKSVSRAMIASRPTINRIESQPPPVEKTQTTENEPARTTTADLKESGADAVQQSTESRASVAERIRSEKRVGNSAAEQPTNSALGSEIATKHRPGTYGLETDRKELDEERVAASGIATRTTGPMTKANRQSKVGLNTKRTSRKQRRTTVDGFGLAAIETAYPTATSSSVRQRRKEMESAGSPKGIRDLSLANQLNTTGTTVNEIGAVPLPPVSELQARSGKWPRWSAFTNRDVTANPDTSVSRITPKAASQRGLSIRAIVSPDLSTIGLKNFEKPGTNVGLLLEYRIASRWSVQAGVMQSTKVYRALSGDYPMPPAGTWGGYLKPESVDGRCNMLDIPINLRYDVIIRSQRDGQLINRWFVSGGATSYIMNQERYTYNYAYSPHNYQRTDTTASTGGYGFSNVNFSLGYERGVSKRLSLQLEPFMKVPLQGVGYFKVRLISTGAFFSIRYKLSK
ncbi:porin family protein [Spirosoma koreense]